MGSDARARELAQVAAGLAKGAAIELPETLALWRLAGGRPSAPATHAADPARALGDALEGSLDRDERRQGAHYTPPPLAARVVELAGCARGPVVDPACGGGALLLAAADRLVGAGHAPGVVARDLLWGADLAPLATAVTEAAIALWSGGTAPAHGHLVVADALECGRSAWACAPVDGFAAVIANPPFQNQLAVDTVRSGARQRALRERFGPAVTPYVDTAALFLLVGCELVADGGSVAMVQPQSTVASRDAGPVRAALAELGTLVDLWVPDVPPFAARVHVCVPVLSAGPSGDPGAWARLLAAARGVPAIDLHADATVASLASAVAGFRQHYYALVDHVRESGGDDDDGALVTSGLIDLGVSTWGQRPVRFAKRAWTRPVVDVDAVRAASTLEDGWLDRVLRTKVLVATQTRVVEAVADRSGAWVPATPVVSVVPHDPADVHRLCAALCAPPVAVWAATTAAGTGMSPSSVRMSSTLALAAPLPDDRARWDAATAALADGDLDAFAEHATAMHRLPGAVADRVLEWWHVQRP